MVSITLAIVIAIVVAAVAAAVAVAYCRHHTGKCDARIEGILSEKAMEISEPMTKVIGPLSLLLKKEAAGTPNRRMLQMALVNAERVCSIMGLELGAKDMFKGLSKKAVDISSKEIDVKSQSEDPNPVNPVTHQTPQTLTRVSTIVEPSDLESEVSSEDLAEAMGEVLYDANAFLERAQGVVEDHIGDVNFDKDTFAIEMYISPSTLYKRIKELTGLSPSDYIKEMRLNRAMSLVEETDLSISLISDMCGFSTVAYFGHSFRKRYGLTPSEKRKEINKESKD